MYKFGTRSLSRIATLHPDLQAVVHRAMDLQIMDFTIICGHRTKEAQDEAFAIGNSKTQWPNSKHNITPSVAVDVAPWPIDWEDHYAFSKLAGIFFAAARLEGAGIRWGGDWDEDNRSTDQSFMDIGHFELTSALASAL